MSLNRKATVWLVGFVALLMTAAYVLAQVRALDAYGECHKAENFGLCVDAWLEPGMVPFKRLVSDQELIDRFNRHRSELEEMQAWAAGNRGCSPGCPADRWEGSLGIKWISRLTQWPPSGICDKLPPSSTPEQCRGHNWDWEVHKFNADRTRAIDREYWPWSNMTKGYTYFLSPPRIDDGWVVDQYGQRQWLLRNNLDASWPEEFAKQQCLMRRIDAQWFLILCKNDIGR